MGKGEADQVKHGFARWLEEASCITPILSFRYATFDQHPLGYGLKYPGIEERKPSRIEHLASCGEFAGLHALIRLVSWEMTNDCLGGTHHPVYFLRITSADSELTWGDHKQQDHYYEIALNDRHFMIGGPLASWGVSERGREETEAVFSFLSSTYGIPVYRVRHDGRQYITLTHFFNARVRQSYLEQEGWELERVESEKRYRNFKPGQQVQWNKHFVTRPSFLKYDHRWPDRARYEIKAVERYPTECSCGLGNQASIHLHPEGLCQRRKTFEAAHHQRVLVRLEGKDKWVSGIFFDTCPP